MKNCGCKSSYTSSNLVDSTRRMHILGGFQIAGTTIAAPLVGAEFRLTKRWSLRNSTSVAFHYFYKSVSYELMEKVRFNFNIRPWISITTGPGISFLFNPKYIRNPYDPRFSNCGMSKCPSTRIFLLYDLGFQITPLRKLPLQFNTLFSIYSYQFIGKSVLKDDPILPFLTLELTYKFL